MDNGATDDGLADLTSFFCLSLMLDLQWFFRMLDVQKEGYLTAFSIRYLFGEVGKRMQDFGFEAPSVDDVKDEVFDMARPKVPSRITLEDFLACGVGSIIVR